MLRRAGPILAAFAILPLASQALGTEIDARGAGVERIRASLAAAISRDELCGSVTERDRSREICSESSWQEVCADLGRSEPEDTPVATVAESAELLATRFVRDVTFDVLCRSAASRAERWDYLEVPWKHRERLKLAARAFTNGLDRAYRKLSGRLADLQNDAKLYRLARKRNAERRRGPGERPLEPIRFIDSDGEDLTAHVCDEQVKLAERSVDDTWVFRQAYAGRALAGYELASADALLRNGLSMVSWGLTNATECQVVVDVPMWLTGDTPLVPGSEIPIPAPPSIFRIDTAGSPLSAAAALVRADRAWQELSREVASDESPSESSCEALARAVDDLTASGHDAIERANREDNPESFRSARSAMTRWEILGLLSLGNRALVDLCGLDRNAIRWHRRFIQQTATLTRDLDPPSGDLLRDLLRNTFAERVD